MLLKIATTYPLKTFWDTATEICYVGETNISTLSSRVASKSMHFFEQTVREVSGLSRHQFLTNVQTCTIIF